MAESSFCCADEKNERKNESSSNDDAIATTISFLLFSFEVSSSSSLVTNEMRALEGNEGKLRCEMSSYLHARIPTSCAVCEYNNTKNTKSGERTPIP